MNLLKILSKKGTAKIMTELSKKGCQSFGKLAGLTDYPSTTARRLNELVKNGFVKRHVKSDALRTVEYELTQTGKEIAEILTRLERYER